MSRSLKLRLLSGMWLAGLGLWGVALGGMTFRFGLLVVMLIAAFEWTRLSLARVRSLVFLALSILLLWGMHWSVLSPHGFLVPYKVFALWGTLALWIIFFIIGVWGIKREDFVKYSRITQGFGFFYLSLALLSLLWLRMHKNGINMFMFVLIIVVVTDVCAYFGGRLVGGKKLAPMISPNKTWSGSLIGGSLAVIAGVCFGYKTLHFPLSVLIALSFGATFVSQVGDLFISLLKRFVNVKDTGNLIPGHGGVLDRFDGFFPASIMVAFAFVFFIYLNAFLMTFILK